MFTDGVITFSNSLTFTNPYGLRVPLGWENYLPPTWTFLIYNALSLVILFFITGFSSNRTERFYTILIPAFSGILWWFGWMSSYNVATHTVIWAPQLAGITFAALLGVGVYLKTANRDRYGTGGPGLTLLNVLYFVILIQTAVGLVNAGSIWNSNAAVTPQAYQYNNVDIGQQVSSYNNQGGFMGQIGAIASQLTILAVQAGQTLLMVLASIAFFAPVMLSTFPWIAGSPWAVALLFSVNVILDLIYGWFIFLIFFKPPVVDQLGV